MATPRRQFNLCQGGTVAAWDGTAPATMLFAAVTDVHWKPDNVVQTTNTLRGSLVMSDGADVLGKAGMVVLSSLLSYEDAVYPLESSYGFATPSTAGTATGGTAYKRVYTPAGTIEDTPRLRRLEVANNVLAGYIPTALPSTWEIAGQVRQFTTMVTNWWGSQYVAGTVTAGITKRTVERVKAGNFSFYIDAQTGTMGSTLVTDCITAFSWKSGNVWMPKNCLSGSLIVTGFAQAPIQPTVDLTIQLGTLTELLKARYQAGSAMYLRAEALGGTIGTGGTVQKTWRGEMCAQITAWPDEGNTEAENGEVVAVTFTAIDDLVGTFGKSVQYTSINSNATIA